MDYVCEWSEDDEDCWDTACGGRFVVLDGTPSDNNMGYCPYCGKSLKEKRKENEPNT